MIFKQVLHRYKYVLSTILVLSLIIYFHINNTSDWFGIKNIICSSNSVDCYNPKVIQASTGSICRVNISYMDFEKLLNSENYNTVAADLEGQNLRDFNFSENQIIFFGSESNGFSKKLSSQFDHNITIQRYNDNVESLNLATSVGIILSELKSQITGK